MNKDSVYLVGGAVRDELLGLQITDRDWVVVGAMPINLLKLNYQQVGKDFPVFLHPVTKEEYALARTEKKVSKGYTGFICDFSPDITLKEDLSRRDLTINAMAKDDQGNIIDHFNGIADIKNKILRHVSPAFSEDPLRVLRVARFAAKYHYLGFKIADETKSLMVDIVNGNQLTELSAERVWLETTKALSTNDPQIYFQTLLDIGGLKILFPEIQALFGVPNPPKHHPEIDTGIHSLLSLKQASILTKNLPLERGNIIKFAALCHDIGKALTPKDTWPKHYKHDILGVDVVTNLLKRLKAPKEYINFCQNACRYHMLIHQAFELRSNTILRIFNTIDIWRKPDLLLDMCLVAEADAKGRTGYEHINYINYSYLNTIYQACLQVNVREILQKGYTGIAIKNQINKRRMQLITAAKKNF